MDKNLPAFDETLPADDLQASAELPSFEQTSPISEEEKEKMAAYVSTPDKTSQGEAAGLGAVAGATFDFDDELAGGMGAVMEKTLGNPEKKDLAALYNEYRDARRKTKDTAMEEHPWSYMGGGAAGGFVLPGAGLGQAGKAANIWQKIGRGAAVGGGVGALTGGGMSEHNPIEKPKEFAGDMLSGGEMGMMIGGAVPIAGQVGKGMWEGAKWLGSPISKGFKQGWRGNNLLGEEAEKMVQQRIAAFGKDTSGKMIDDLNALAQSKAALMDIAEQMGVKIDQAEIDKMIVSKMGNSAEETSSQLKQVRREMEDLKELIRSHREGPEVDQVNRVFFGDKNTQLQKFQQLLDQKKTLQEANKILPSGERPIITPGVGKTEKEAFEELFKRKQAEQKAIPGASTSHPMEISYEPIEGTNEVLGVIKQPQFDVDGQFIGYKKIATKQLHPERQVKRGLTPEGPTPSEQPLEMIFEPLGEGKVQGIIRQPIVDEAGNITGYKNVVSRAMDEAEAAKFKDITSKVRSGGRDLTNIKNFKRMLDDLKEVGQYGGTPFASREASNKAGNLFTEGRDMLRNRVDTALTEEFGPNMQTLGKVDGDIHSIKKGIETLRLGDETINQSVQDKQKAYEAMVDLINRQELVGGSGAKARERAAQFVEEIRKVDPKYAAKLEAQIADLGEQASVSKVTAGITDASKLSGVKRHAVAAGNMMGLGANKMAAGIEKLRNMAPDSMRAIGQRFLVDPTSKGKQELGKILSKLPDKTERERNAILFGIMQNPAYRKWLQEEDQQMSLPE
jgi:hypothetical protein